MRRKNSLCDIHTTVLQAKKDGAVGPFSCSFAVAAAYLSALVKLLFFFYRSCFCLPSALFKNSPSFRPLVSSLVFLVFRKRPRQVKLKQFKLKLRLCRQIVYCAIIMSTLFLFLLLACEIITLRFCFFSCYGSRRAQFCYISFFFRRLIFKLPPPPFVLLLWTNACQQFMAAFFLLSHLLTLCLSLCLHHQCRLTLVSACLFVFVCASVCICISCCCCCFLFFVLKGKGREENKFLDSNSRVTRTHNLIFFYCFLLLPTAEEVNFKSAATQCFLFLH